MEFPVDVLDTLRHGELETLAHSYMNKLLYSNPDHAQHFTLPSGKEVEISLSTVGFVPLYGADDQHKVLALFTPQDQFTAVALFLENQWFAVEDILKTASPTREGPIEVRSVGERIVLYVLNRIVYRANEMASGEVPFLCHGANDYAKIFWKDGEAVGFYSVKSKGSVCNNSTRQCYFLPVMDSIFVRKAHRGKNHGLQMLEDFVDSFEEHELGVKYPLPPAMANVCRRYLERYPADVNLLWEVQGVGGPYQRARLATKLASVPFNADAGRTKDAGQNGKMADEELASMEETSLDITEEVIVVKQSHKEAEETSAPVVRSQNSEYKRRKRLRDEAGINEEESRPEKMNRVEVAEEKKEELVLANQTVDESVGSETPGKVEDQKEVKEDMEEVGSLLQNGTARKEEQMEVEVEQEADEHHSRAVKDSDDRVDTSNVLDGEKLDNATTEEQEVGLDPIAEVQLEDGNLAAEEEGREVEDLAAHEDVKHDANVPDEVEMAPAPVDQLEDPPLVEEQPEVSAAPEDHDMTTAAEEEPDVSPAPHVTEDQQKAATEGMTSAVTDEPDVAAAAEEEQEAALTIDKEQEMAQPADDEPSGDVEFRKIIPVGEETGAENGNVVSPGAEEKPEVGDAADQEEKEAAPSPEEDQDMVPSATDDENKAVSTVLEDKEEDLEEDHEASPADEEEGRAEDMDGLDEEMMDTPPKEESQASAKKENDSRSIEEEEEEEKSLPNTEEGGKSSDEAPDIQVLQETRIEAAPPSPKQATKRLSTVVPEREEETKPKEVTVEGPEDEKMIADEEMEPSTVGVVQDEDPPAIDRRVLRGKTKDIQATSRSRSKRRSRM
ncbi:soluble lamin-associated protein of 75 kDa isoform X2 [Trichomycterus rosablanca]|uniref:soluble lamin-associated protein of 75 kDa isoform X2 n=1 Tax=Trichomycterus rosablanca TaxID=2290929 RepID=UPI002F3600FA